MDVPYPAIALAVGIATAMVRDRPLPGKRASKWLLQASVVLLGFSLDLGTVLKAGLEGFGFALVSIATVFALGELLRRVLDIRKVTSLLVCAGTAICGGSAIAAVSQVLDAEAEDVAVATATVFLLNAVALFVFPPIGHAIGLGSRDFGVWSGIAIHDVASVVGAAATYAPGALETATAVKLSRVLYLVPLVLLLRATSARGGEGGAPPIPWFIGLFLLASLARTTLPMVAAQSPAIQAVAKVGFSISLLLIGGAITRKTLRQVGVRPLLQGSVLWLVLSLLAILAVRA